MDGQRGAGLSRSNNARPQMAPFHRQDYQRARRTVDRPACAALPISAVCLCDSVQCNYSRVMKCDYITDSGGGCGVYLQRAAAPERPVTSDSRLHTLCE